MVNPLLYRRVRLVLEGRLSKYSVPRMLAGIETPVPDREPRSTVILAVWAAVYAPNPETPAVCVPPMAVSTRVKSATRFPIAVGLKETVTVQEDPAAKDAPQLFVELKSPGPGETELSVPVMPMLVKLAEPDPVAVMVNVLVTAAPPTACDPQF